MQDSVKKTYTPQEVAFMLGISKSYVYELIKRGELPTLKLGKRRLIPKQRFDNWLNNMN